MSRKLAAALVAANVAFLAGPCLAQSRMEKATAAAARTVESGNQPTSPGREVSTTAMPTAPDSVVLEDAPTRQRYLQAMRRYYEYRESGYAYRSRVFEWQLLSSRLIFVVVLALVASGMYFAAVQFRMAMRAAARAPTATEPPPDRGATLATQFEISAKGLVVNSSVMGVIILALSLAFFYLYLVYVYPIENVF